jgi:DNA-binding response OmpR family regulator
MPGQSKKILIVEDEKPLSRALQLKLTSSGFSVKAAYDGEEALSILSGEQFDLIVLDLILPKLTGFEVLEELKKKKSTTPVIVASNLSQGEDQERAKTLGARDYFVKSDTSLSQVVEHITKILNG